MRQGRDERQYWAPYGGDYHSGVCNWLRVILSERSESWNIYSQAPISHGLRPAPGGVWQFYPVLGRADWTLVVRGSPRVKSHKWYVRKW